MTPPVWGGRGGAPATATALQVPHEPASRSRLPSRLGAACGGPCAARPAGGGLPAARPGHQQHVLARVPSSASKSLPSLDLGLLEAGSHSRAGLRPLAELSPWVPEQRLCPGRLAGHCGSSRRAASTGLRPSAQPRSAPSTQVPSDTPVTSQAKAHLGDPPPPGGLQLFPGSPHVPATPRPTLPPPRLLIPPAGPSPWPRATAAHLLLRLCPGPQATAHPGPSAAHPASRSGPAAPQRTRGLTRTGRGHCGGHGTDPAATANVTNKILS